MAGEHLKSGEVGLRDADRFGGIDPIRDRNQEARRADRIVCVAANDTEIGDKLAFAGRGHARPVVSTTPTRS